MSELPVGWQNSPLEDVGEFVNGYAFKSRDFTSAGIPVIRIGDISEGTVTFSDTTRFLPEAFATQHARFCAQSGDFLLALSGATTGKGGFYHFDELALVNQRVLCIRTATDDESAQRFLGLFVSKTAELILKQAYGGAQPNISPTEIKRFNIQFPPLNEQRRIVAKLEKCEARIGAAREALDEVPKLLEQYRQSVLAAAFRGDLTRDWRAANPDVEPATELLARLRTERRQRWEQAELAKYEAKGKTPPNNWQSKYKEPQPLTEAQLADLPEIPEGWCWAALGEFPLLTRGRFSIRPRNDPAYYDGDHPFVQIGDLPRNGGNITEFHQTLNDKGTTVSKQFNAGTILIAIVGATIGNTGILTFDCYCPDSLIAIDGVDQEHTELTEYYLRSRKEQLRFDSISSGGQPNINVALLNEFPVPLPPESEIRPLLSRLRDVESLVDTLRSTYTGTSADLTTLTQSLLAKAFRGELVPQDPNDEPASELLARLREQRATEAAAKKKPKRKAARKKRA